MTSESESDSKSTRISSLESDFLSGSESDIQSDTELYLATTSESETESERRALIFGNNAYHGNDRLQSCRKDARDVTRVLTELGFNCTTVLDAIKSHMEIELKAFCQEINENDCALVYFSGHGVEKNSENYLMPIESDDDSDDNFISLNYIIRKLNKCGNKLNIIILDACRSDKKNHVFKQKAVDKMVKLISKETTTSIIDSRKVQPQFALVFSCDPGRYSMDGHNSKNNSIFTEALLDHLNEEDLTLHDMMFQITSNVSKKTKNKQQPWIHCRLKEPFCFNIGLDPFVRTSQLDFDLLQEPRCEIVFSCQSRAMASNEEYVLYCPEGRLRVVDTDGDKKSSIERRFHVKDMCWSSYKKRFLILGKNKRLYSFNIDSGQNKEVKKFQKQLCSLTCYQNRLLSSSADTVREYDMEDWTFVKKFCLYESIHRIRFNSNGMYLGVIIHKSVTMKDPWFQLHDSSNMNVLRKIDINRSSPDLISLPNNQFLISWTGETKFKVIDPNNKSIKKIQCGETIRSLAFMSDRKCLVIQTADPKSLRFYDL